MRWVLVAIIAIGAALRFYNTNWDDGYHVHPDERHIVMVKETLYWPEDVGNLLRPSRSPLNPFYEVPRGRPEEARPRHFAYGHFPLYLLHFLSEGLATLGRRLVSDNPAPPGWAMTLSHIAEYGQVNLLGRVLSATFDTGTMIFVYLLAKRLFDRRVGLLAVTLAAFTVLHIQLAHFYAVDTVMAFFVVAAIYFGVGLVQRGDYRNALLAGVCTGLAVASKFSAAPMVLPLLVAHAVRVWRERERVANGEWRMANGEWRMANGEEQVANTASPWGRLAISVIAALGVYFLTSPYVFLDFKSFVESIGWEGKMVRGTVDLPYPRQYRRTTPYLYHIVQLLRWGMGWPLGMAGFLGLVWVTVRVAFGFWKSANQRISALIVPLSWVWPYFLITGSFMVKFQRYMVLVTPFLCIFGAALLVRVKHELEGHEIRVFRVFRDSFRDWRRVLGNGLIGVVVLGTALWAWAFMSVYRHPLTRVVATEWIYRNIPPGSTITTEAWDDHLPFARIVDGEAHSAGEYRQIEMALQEPDDENKFRMIADALRQADYIIISSNRFYGWLPRLRDRFPITNRYYDLLFAEQLGFVKVAEFTSYPRLGGLVIVDDHADESFTVYDHPKVLIYKKVRTLSEAELRDLFAEALEQARHRPQSYRREPDLLLPEPVDTRPVVDDFAWNKTATGSTALAVFLWWLVVALLGLLAWPLAYVVFPGLADRGHAMSRALALLVIGYLVWLPASLRWWRNTLPAILGATAALGLLSLFLFLRHRREMLAFWQKQWPLLLLSEGVFAAAYLLMVGIRILNPDLWHPWLGGEKFMDLAYLNAVLRSPYFPPHDPFFAHGYLNYYYYGQFLMSLPVKLSGIAPRVAYNLIVPTLFALLVGHVFSGGYTLGRRLKDWKKGRLGDWEIGGLGDWEERETSGKGSTSFQSSNLPTIQPSRSPAIQIITGLVAAVFVAVLGNLEGMLQLLKRLGEAGGSGFRSAIPGLQTLVRAGVGLVAVLRGQPLPGFDYWAPTRVIPGTINEFPWFSFIFADLHPHMINLPFTALVIGLAASFLLGRMEEWRIGRLEKGVQFLVWPLALGALAVINTWDFPTYLGLTALVVLLRYLRLHRSQPSNLLTFQPSNLPTFQPSNLLTSLAFILAIAALSLLAYRPFFHWYHPLYVGVGVGFLRGHTSLGRFLDIWGLFLFIVASFLLMELARQRERGRVLRVIRLGLRYWRVWPHLVDLMAALRKPTGEGTLWPLIAVAALAVLAILALLGHWVLLLVLFLLALTGLLLTRRKAHPATLFVYALLFVGLLVAGGVEVFYLKDHLAGSPDAWRMNTLFKFYLQVWVLLGLGTAVAVVQVLQIANRKLQIANRRGAKKWGWGIWQVVLAVLLLAALVYPVLGTRARVMDRFPVSPPLGTLDGMEFMRYATYTWPEGNTIVMKYDHEALRWLQDNVRGTPVVAEAKIGYYREGGMRVAAFTGLPITLGGLHVNEQRPAWQDSQRAALVADFFRTPDPERAMEIIRELHISYIYIGQLERAIYPPEGIAKFTWMVEQGRLTEAFRNEGVVIYQVR